MAQSQSIMMNPSHLYQLVFTYVLLRYFRQYQNPTHPLTKVWYSNPKKKMKYHSWYSADYKLLTIYWYEKLQTSDRMKEIKVESVSCWHGICATFMILNVSAFLKLFLHFCATYRKGRHQKIVTCRKIT